MEGWRTTSGRNYALLCVSNSVGTGMYVLYDSLVGQLIVSAGQPCSTVTS